MAAAAIPLCLVGLDAVLGQEAPQRTLAGAAARLLPKIYIVLQLAVTTWAAVVVASPDTGPLEAMGLAVSCGVTTGVFGFVAAHEMIHSRSRRDRALGLTLFGAVFYMHFRIAHVYGHHRRAATADDPATARFGESLHAFLPRSIAGQVREAWMFEVRRLRRAGRPGISFGNRMIGYLAIEASLLLTLAFLSARMFVFFIATAVIAIFLLESFNYVAHYGLRRSVGAQGHMEAIGPQHSWNSGRLINNAALFNMGRHSDHHRRTTRPYAQLEAIPGAAQLPSGYAAALMAALVPPLWRRMMDPRVAAVASTRCPTGEPHDFRPYVEANKSDPGDGSDRRVGGQGRPLALPRCH
jgi:alkane 1-monooxygenase